MKTALEHWNEHYIGPVTPGFARRLVEAVREEFAQEATTVLKHLGEVGDRQHRDVWRAAARSVEALAKGTK